MKVKHNKKRNTAFLYEALVRELTKAVVEQNVTRSQKIKKILKGLKKLYNLLKIKNGIVL